MTYPVPLLATHATGIALFGNLDQTIYESEKVGCQLSRRGSCHDINHNEDAGMNRGTSSPSMTLTAELKQKAKTIVICELGLVVCARLIQQYEEESGDYTSHQWPGGESACTINEQSAKLLFPPSVHVERERIFEALDEVPRFCEWLENQLSKCSPNLAPLRIL